MAQQSEHAHHEQPAQHLKLRCTRMISCGNSSDVMIANVVFLRFDLKQRQESVLRCLVQCCGVYLSVVVSDVNEEAPSRSTAGALEAASF